MLVLTAMDVKVVDADAVNENRTLEIESKSGSIKFPTNNLRSSQAKPGTEPLRALPSGRASGVCPLTSLFSLFISIN